MVNTCFCWMLVITDTCDKRRSVTKLNSSSTPQISIHWRHYLKSWSDLRVFSNRHPSQILRSVADLLVRVRAYVSDVDLRKWETGIDWELNINLRICKRTSLDADLRYWKKDLDLRYRCLSRRNRTWIWELDVD